MSPNSSSPQDSHYRLAQNGLGPMQLPKAYPTHMSHSTDRTQTLDYRVSPLRVPFQSNHHDHIMTVHL